MTDSSQVDVNAAAQSIRTQIKATGRNFNERNPGIGLVLGSGLGHLGDQFIVRGAAAIPFADIPGFPLSSVSGHAGRLVVHPSKNIFVMQGRVHFYEGYSPQEVVFPVRVLQELGVRTLILTNAAGAVCKSFAPGDLMLIEDYLRFIPGATPSAGPSGNNSTGRDPLQVFCPETRSVAQAIAKRIDQPVQSGVYAAMPGPNYETPAEVVMLRGLGADAVGMSTVLEAQTAAQMGMRVLGISCITNSASGIAGPLSHDEVTETANDVKDAFGDYVLQLIDEFSDA